MIDLDKPFSDRERYQSSFASTVLHALNFFVSVLLSVSCWILCLKVILDALFSGTLLQLTYWIGLAGLPLLALLGPLLFSEPHWRTGIQNHRIARWKQHVYAGITGSCVVALIIADAFPLPALMTMGIGLLGLCALAGLSGPWYVLAAQFASWRQLLRAARYDAIRNEYSPSYELVNPLNRSLRWLGQTITLRNYRSIIFVAFIGGGVLIPVMTVSADQGFNFITLSPFQTDLQFHVITRDAAHLWDAFLTKGLPSIALIFSILFGTALIFRRQRYIFTPFTTVELPKVAAADAPPIALPKGTIYLDSAAQHLTQRFIEQLEHIGFLLTTRQVEDVNGRERIPLAEFITSGNDQEVIAALQSLVDIDERAKNIPGKLLAALTKVLAVLTLSGTLRRRDDTELELEVRLTPRFGNQTSVIVPIPSPLGNEGPIDDATAIQVARAAAVRLLLRSGAVDHIASSESSLAAFLDGLEASSARNWWRAAAAYRQAIQHEETVHGSFGIGRYHLGVVLIRQGEFQAGIQNLEQAQRASGPFADIQYMLAVTQLHQHWNTLHEHEPSFRSIVRHCWRAAHARRSFPEAYHVLGAAFYHRGKLFERAATQTYAPSSELQANRRIKQRTLRRARADYTLAIRYLRRAVRQYDQQTRRMHTRIGGSPLLSDELERLHRDRMTATHQLADALRSAGFYALAESYYGDVLAAYPSNVRTLIDLTKTLVLARHWRRADEFLIRQVLTIPEARWNADVHLYAGWIYAGGVAEQVSLHRWQRRWVAGVTASLRWIHQRLEHHPLPATRHFEPHQLLRIGIGHLDFALHQRPRFMTSWRQTAWQTELVQALDALEKHAWVQTPTVKQAYRQPLHDDGPKAARDSTHLVQLRAWIAWRIHSALSPDDKVATIASAMPLPVRAPDVNNTQVSLAIDDYPLPDFAACYEELKYLRTRVVVLLEQIDHSGRLRGMTNAKQKLDLAAMTLDVWKLANSRLKDVRALIPANGPFSFGARWAYDVYAEITLLTVRLLAEAEAYEIAWNVAAVGTRIVRAWIVRWDASYPQSALALPFRLSPYVSRYQLASLYAWKAYAAVQLLEDPQVMARLVMGKDRYLGIDKQACDDIPALYEALKGLNNPDATERARALLRLARDEQAWDIREALQQVPQHPLARMLHARRLWDEQQLSHAISELQRLLEVLAPFDPNRFIANWRILDKQRPPLPAPDGYASPGSPAKLVDTRRALHDQELVSGRQQFAHVVQPYSVHALLADIFATQGRLHLSVQHLMLAITTSPHWDIDADDLLLTLVQRLDQLDRLADARAVISTLRASRRVLEQNSFSLAKLYRPDVWECIILTRINRYADSLAHGSVLLQRLESLSEAIGKQQIAVYRERLRAIPATSEALVTIFDRAWAIDLRAVPAGSAPPAAPTHGAPLSAASSPGTLASSETPLRQYMEWFSHIAVIRHYLESATTQPPLDIDHVLDALAQQPPAPVIGSNEGWLHAYRETLSAQVPKLDINRNLITQYVNFLAVEAISMDELWAQLLNNLAYNAIELRLLDRPSSRSTLQSDTLLVTAAINPDKLITDAVKMMKDLAQHTQLPDFYRERVRRELAYYHDTYGWMHYRHARLEQNTAKNSMKRLYAAQRELDIALRYEQRSAVIYYHAARIALTLLERSWHQDQRSSGTVGQDAAQAPIIPADISLQIDNYLVAAHYYWIQARMHDHDQRFTSHLSWIGLRIEQYRATWNTRLIKLFN